VKQVFTPVVWKIRVPPRIHIFLWLLANIKTLIRDNLVKRRNVEDKTCLFCAKAELVHHLFYDCCVAQSMWWTISEITGVDIQSDFESMARMWLSEKRFGCLNVCTSAVLWALWKIRNDLCFHGVCWMGISRVYGRCAGILKNWSLVNKTEDVKKW
jgi:hypothetical protein